MGWAVPAAHGVQSAAPALLNIPAGQLVHEEPAVLACVPAEHGVHELEPVTLDEPGLQGAQATSPGLFAKYPLAHGMQLVCPEVGCEVPTGQESQEASPWLG